MRTLKYILIFGGLGMSSVASANAFFIDEHDARATGRGDAATASDTGPSSIFYNPGGVAVGEGTNFSIGGSYIVAGGSFTPMGSTTKTDTDSGPAVLPQLYVTHRFNDLISAGLGFYTPFGLTISWPDSSPQNDVLKKQTLATFFISPVIGLNLNKFVPGLSVGAGVDIVPATVELTQYIFFGDPATGGTQGTAHLGGTAVGIGGRIGAMYRPAMLPKLSVGLMYRTQVNEDFTGKGDFDIAPPYRSQLPPDGDVAVSVKLPQKVAGGVAYRPTDALELEVDVSWMNWAAFKDLAITVPKAGGGTTTNTTAENYQNETTIRVGAEYRMPSIESAFRLGYIYDPTPIPSQSLTAQLPDANRNDITAGASHQFGDYNVNLGLLYVIPVKRDTSSDPGTPIYKGTYEINAFVASLSVGGRFH